MDGLLKYYDSNFSGSYDSLSYSSSDSSVEDWEDSTESTQEYDWEDYYISPLKRTRQEAGLSEELPAARKRPYPEGRLNTLTNALDAMNVDN